MRKQKQKGIGRLAQAPPHWERTPVHHFQSGFPHSASHSLIPPALAGLQGLGEELSPEPGLRRGDPVITIALTAVVPTCV